MDAADKQALIERIRANVPRLVRELAVWLLWSEPEPGKKRPIYASGVNRHGTLDSPEDRAELVEFEDAGYKFVKIKRAVGLAIALGRVPDTDIHIGGIDLDDCYVDGVAREPGASVLAANTSYAEKSPSRGGAHIVGFGGNMGIAEVIPIDGQKCEIYPDKRFFTVTGEALNGAAFEDIAATTALARKLYGAARIGGSADAPRASTAPAGSGNRVVAALKAFSLYLRAGGGGKHFMRCPWAHLHTSNSGDPEACYFEPGAPVRGERSVFGGFKCQHAHCAKRGLKDLRDYLGLVTPTATPEAAAEATDDREADEAPSPIILRESSADELLAPIAPERYLLPSVPAEAYTVIAGALSSYKTMLLLYWLAWRATGWDVLGLDEVGYGCDPGPAVLLTYEDTDARILAKLQRVIQHGHRIITERWGAQDAAKFVAAAAANIRRITLAGHAEASLVCRLDGTISPNKAMLDTLTERIRAYAPDGALISIDPLRLAICGSQNDDDGADVVVHTLNYLATRIPGSGVVVCSHATKADAKDPLSGLGGYANAAYATSGSALYSQHARSNYQLTRMKTWEIKRKFVEGTVTAEEAKRQRVARLIHARLSHGVEREETFLLMRDGTLTRIKPKEAEPPEVRAERSAVPVFEAIDRIHAAAAGARVSETMLTADEPLRQALGGRDGVREVLHALLQMGYLETTGSTKDKDIVVTAAGRALASRANARESVDA
jgi:hypothetical protein